MAFSQSDIDALEKAIATGALVVKYQDRQVQYRSLDEMRKILLIMKQDVGTAKKGPFRTRFSYSKGFKNEC